MPDVLVSSRLASSSEKCPSSPKNDLSSSLRNIASSILGKAKRPVHECRFRSKRRSVRPVSTSSLDGHPRAPLLCPTAKSCDDK
ncbi:hypothetical protein PAL_GLEAN10022836 [Pteropus alecto]|uniref:Uncharacterized protein n=1 Tax=Pteropus alecto TaxID=9402 RepID=L5K6Y8_PTEAL|nr:hypothetical protein PAL_GLEAN10022836 [Pteropus alecto]